MSWRAGVPPVTTRSDWDRTLAFPSSDPVPFALHAALIPPSNDNTWGYGGPVVCDAVGAREEVSARHLVAKALAAHLSATGTDSDPLIAATAAAAKDLRSYRGDAHLDATRALIDAKEWDRARIAALGIAFWARGTSMHPERRSLGLYIEILAKMGLEIPLAVAEQQLNHVRAWIKS